MQRTPKKTKSPDNIVTKAGKPISPNGSKQETVSQSKKKSVIVADKITKRLKAETSAKAAPAPPKANKKATINQPSKQKKENIATAAAAKKTKTIQIKPVTANKKTTEKKLEIVIPPIIQKPIKKKVKPIGSAVVRGKSGRYDFEVFSIDAELKDGSAIYVISKRVTDQRGKGHLKFVCIGQTDSLLGDLKKHTKGKCIKQHKANVICLLREESEKNRLKIETDLREAHTIVCNQK